MSFDRSTIIPTAAEKAALEIIQNHRALIQTVSDQEEDDAGNYVRDYSSIDDLLNQLFDPNKYRPSRSEELFKIAGKIRPVTLQKTNLKTHEVTTNEPGQCRNKKHKDIQFAHTAKTSTSLLPPEPQYMTPFGMGNFIGFGWDIDTCNTKDERYVWAEDAGTDCQWLSPYPNPYNDPDGIDKVFWSIPLSSIEGLRAKNNKAVENKEVIEWNELLSGLPYRKLPFMFINHDELDYRLRLWDAMERSKERLLFIIGDNGVSIYCAAEHELDLKMSNNLQKNEKLITNNQALFFAKNNHRDHAQALHHEHTHSKLAPRKPLSLSKHQ